MGQHKPKDLVISRQVCALPSPSPAKQVLTEARLWEELECLLGSMEEIPLSVSLLLLPGLCTLLLEYPAVGKVTQKQDFRPR